MQTETKKFYLTSEFWLTVATLLATVTDLVPTKYKGTIAGIVTAAYAISRGLAKQGVPNTEIPVTPPQAIPADVGDAGNADVS